MRGTKPRLVVSNDAVADIPKPPVWLSKDGCTEWRRVTPDLVARGVLTDTDLASLAAYCAAVAGVCETMRLIKRQGRMVGKRAHPAVRMQLQYLESARRYAAELGLTPVARQRAAAPSSPKGEEDDDWA